jgi:hypothetical protein
VDNDDDDDDKYRMSQFTNSQNPNFPRIRFNITFLSISPEFPVLFYAFLVFHGLDILGPSHVP